MHTIGNKIETQQIIDVIINEKKFIKERIQQIQQSRFDKYMHVYSQNQMEIVKEEVRKGGMMTMRGVGIVEITD